jgi:hypothetical protein
MATTQRIHLEPSTCIHAVMVVPSGFNVTTGTNQALCFPIHATDTPYGTGVRLVEYMGFVP